MAVFQKFFSPLSEKKAKRAVGLLLVVAVCLLVGALFITLGSDRGYQATTYSMGSYVQQTVYGKKREEAARKAANAAARLEDRISWRKEGSDVQRLNAAAGGDFIPIDAQTQEILKTALKVCEASNGALDITIGPLSRLWGFDENPAVPDAGLVDGLLPQVDYRGLSLTEEGMAALQAQDAAVDLGAVGKGAACDAVLKVYEEEGVDRAVVAVGGSVGVYGSKPFHKPWKIAVRDPAGNGSMGELAISEGFVSTSGNYEKTFTDGDTGKTYHHLLDPKTGWPAESGLISVTVWSQGGALSDALSTACFVLGLENSLSLLRQFDAEAVFITEEKEVYVTQGLAFTLTGGKYTLKELPAP